MSNSILKNKYSEAITPEIEVKKQYTVSELNNFKNSISTFDKTEQMEVLKILNKYRIKLTENKNGVFINLNNVSQKCLNELSIFIKYSISNRKRLDNLELLSQSIFKKSILKNEYEKYDKCTTNNVFIEKENKSVKKKINKVDNGLLNNNLEVMDDTINIDDIDNIDNSTCIQQLGEIDDINEIEESNEPDENYDNIVRFSYYNETNKKKKLPGITAKILKKCKEINKSSHLELSNFNSLITTDNLLISDNNDNESQDNTTIDSLDNIDTNDELTEEFI